MKILVSFLMALFFLGCSSADTKAMNVEPKLVINKSLKDLTLNDQFEKQHKLEPTTTKVIFAFSKDVAHSCNEYLGTKKPTYLKDNNVEFVADISGAPSLIRSMFIMPGLKDFKYNVLIIDDKKVALPYKQGQNVEKILVVELKDGVIVNTKSLSSVEELVKEIEN